MTLPYFHSIDDCIAHFQAMPPDGENIEIELESDMISYLEDRAKHFGCTAELVISAILTLHYQQVTNMSADI